MSTLINFAKRTFTKVITMQTMNQNLLKAKYEVRGGIVLKADEFLNEMNRGKKLPFDQLIYWNIGNPQSLGQLPISFPREVMGYLLGKAASGECSIDAQKRAKIYENELKVMGPYTYFKGMGVVRENVAKFITERDSCETKKENIFLSNGASGGIKMVLQSLLNGEKDTALCPIPQYPLYSAAIQLLGSTLAGYYLNEDKQWEVDINYLKSVFKKYYDSGHNMKAMVVINPGNPTGNILSEKNIKDIIKFCYDHKMVLLADEVYQNNIYSQQKKFISFKKVLSTMDEPYKHCALFSFHSTSKGVIGECGLRGGYTDMFNIPGIIKESILKLKEFDVCPNVIGQLAVDLLVNPPNLNTCSPETVRKYKEETETIANELKQKALMIQNKLKSMNHMKCNDIEGAMYAFPQISLPKSFIEEAKIMKLHPDYYYALRLLEETGLVTVAGSGFGEKEGTFHFRITNLICPKENLMKALDKIKMFNDKLFTQYH